MLDKIKNAFLYVKDFCEDTAENIKETAVNAVDCAKLHYRIVAKRNEVNNLYAILGKNLMNTSDESESKEQTINALCSKITQKEEILSGLLDQYRLVCGKIICPDCGRFMNEGYSYCPYCGNRVSDAPSTPVSDITDEELFDVREIDEL